MVALIAHFDPPKIYFFWTISKFYTYPYTDHGMDAAHGWTKFDEEATEGKGAATAVLPEHLVRLTRPEKFKPGDDRCLFERSFRNWVTVSGIPEKLWAYMFIQNLSSDAQRRLFAFEPQAENLSIGEIFDLFHELFTSPAERLGPRLSLSSRRQKAGECLTDFMEGLLTLARETHMPTAAIGPRVMEAFREGLRNPVLAAKVFEDDKVFEARDTQSLLARVQYLDEMLIYSARRVRSIDQEPRAIAAIHPGKCRNCKKPGHHFRQCPEPLACFRCGGSGHLARNCTQPSENGNGGL